VSENLTVRVKKDGAHKTIWVSCPYCGRVTCHKILTDVESLYTEDTEPGLGLRWWENFLTIQCQGCWGVSFCQESRDDITPIDCDGDEGSPLDPDPVTRTLFPRRVLGCPEMPDARYHLPQGIYSIYKETRDAFCTQMAVLTGLGIRAIVEAVCREKVGEEGGLNQKINRLAAARLISEQEAQVLHSLRFMGNAAAHEAKSHTQDELRTAFEVVEHLLKGVFVLPRYGAKLRGEEEGFF
jgi:hypothetical protein